MLHVSLYKITFVIIYRTTILYIITQLIICAVHRTAHTQNWTCHQVRNFWSWVNIIMMRFESDVIDLRVLPVNNNMYCTQQCYPRRISSEVLKCLPYHTLSGSEFFRLHDNILRILEFVIGSLNVTFLFNISNT